MRSYAPRVQLQTGSGNFVRALPAKLAQEMVDRGEAEVVEGNGRIKYIRLVRVADHVAERIGGPSAWSGTGTTFVRRQKLDSGHVVFEHHPRSRDYE